MDKSEKKRLKQELRKKEKQDFNDSLPMAQKLFDELFDFLEEQSEEHGCDHTLRLTLQFLKNNGIDDDTVVTWLNEQGGYCDCEVLGNVYDSFVWND